MCRGRRGISTKVIAVAVVALVIISGFALYYLGVFGKQPIFSAPSVITWSGSISSVSSKGGVFAIQNASLSSGELQGSVTPKQAGLLQYGEDVSVRMVFYPQQKVLLNTVGKVLSVSTSKTTILLLNQTMPTCAEVTFGLYPSCSGYSIPASWNPRVGNDVNLTVEAETQSPLILITGYKVQAPDTELILVVSNACYSSSCFPLNRNSLMPSSQPLTLTISICVPSDCLVEYNGATSAETSTVGFSVSKPQVYSVTSTSNVPLSLVNVTLSTPASDFIGDVDLNITLSGPVTVAKGTTVTRPYLVSTTTTQTITTLEPQQQYLFSPCGIYSQSWVYQCDSATPSFPPDETGPYVIDTTDYGGPDSPCNFMGSSTTYYCTVVVVNPNASNGWQITLQLQPPTTEVYVAVSVTTSTVSTTITTLTSYTTTVG